jgi:tetratricopeptide (TPR) repeat protein
MLAALELAVELNPSDARSYMHLASARAWTGQPDQAIANVARARKLNPKPVSPWSGSLQIAWAHMAAQRYEEALAALQRSLQLGDRGELFYRALAATYAQLGRAEEARAALGEARRLNPSLTVDKVRRELPWADPAVVDRYADGLRKAGLPEE